MPQGASSLNLTLTESALGSLVSADVRQLEINGVIMTLELDLRPSGNPDAEHRQRDLRHQAKKSLSETAKKLMNKARVRWPKLHKGWRDNVY